MRELENAVKKLLANSMQSTIDPKQLPSKYFAITPLEVTYAELEKKHETEKRQLITSVLETTNGRASPAASQLGIPSSTMYDLMSKFGISKKKSSESIASPEIEA